MRHLSCPASRSSSIRMHKRGGTFTSLVSRKGQAESACRQAGGKEKIHLRVGATEPGHQAPGRSLMSLPPLFVYVAGAMHLVVASANVFAFGQFRYLSWC